MLSCLGFCFGYPRSYCRRGTALALSWRAGAGLSLHETRHAVDNLDLCFSVMLISSCAWAGSCFESAFHGEVLAGLSRCCWRDPTFDLDRSLETCWPRCSAAASFSALIGSANHCHPQSRRSLAGFQCCFLARFGVWSLDFPSDPVVISSRLNGSLDLVTRTDPLLEIWFFRRVCYISSILRWLPAQETLYGAEQKWHLAWPTHSCPMKGTAILTLIS